MAAGSPIGRRLGRAEQAEHHRRGVAGEATHLGQCLAPGLVRLRVLLDRRVLSGISVSYRVFLSWSDFMAIRGARRATAL